MPVDIRVNAQNNVDAKIALTAPEDSQVSLANSGLTTENMKFVVMFKKQRQFLISLIL